MYKSIWKQIRKSPAGLLALVIVALFVLVAIYAPFFASSKPLFVTWDNQSFFPLFRYLFYPGYYSKAIDQFFNLMMFTLPVYVVAYFFFKKKRFYTTVSFVLVQVALFLLILFFPPKNPASSPFSFQEGESRYNWTEELKRMSPYAKLNLLVSYINNKAYQKRMEPFTEEYAKALSKRTGKHIPADPSILPTLWNKEQNHLNEQIEILKKRGDLERLDYIQEKQLWIEREAENVHHLVMPLVRPFNYQEIVGGNQLMNQIVSWYDLSRINRKDLTAALIFGTRISLTVGFGAVLIFLAIGIPLGASAGYFGGKFDLLFSRILEVWEGMPTFFMLLMLVAITESKAIGFIILFIGIFGWTGIARIVRSETLKLRPLSYVQACHTLGFSENRTLFHHVLPNALTIVITLLPFSILGAITAETGLSFLGLGEEGSASIGVLMDEARTHFPAESRLLWPPAIIITCLLASLAILGDTLRDALDPRLR